MVVAAEQVHNLILSFGLMDHPFIVVIITQQFRLDLTLTALLEEKEEQELLEYYGTEMSVHIHAHLQDHHKNEMFNSNRRNR